MADYALVNGVNVLSIHDELVLHEMLDRSEDYEDRKKIRARLKDVMADQRAKREEMIRHRENEREEMLKERVRNADEQKRRTLAMYDAMAKSAPAGGNKVMDVNILREGKESSPGSPTTIGSHKVDQVEEAIRLRQREANERKARMLAAYDNAAKSGPAGSARFIDFESVRPEDFDKFQSQKPSSCFQMKGGIPLATPVKPEIAPRHVPDEYDPQEAAIRKRQQECDDRKRRTLDAYDKAARSRPAGTPVSLYIPQCEGVEPVIEVAGRPCQYKLDSQAPATPPRSRHQFYEHPTQMQPRYKVPGVAEEVDVNHYYRPNQYAADYNHQPPPQPTPQAPPPPQQYYTRQHNQQPQNQQQPQYQQQHPQYQQQQPQYRQPQSQYQQPQSQYQQQPPQPQQYRQQQFGQQQPQSVPQQNNNYRQQLQNNNYQQDEQQQQQYRSSHFYQPNQAVNQSRNVPNSHPIAQSPNQQGRVQQQQQQYLQQRQQQQQVTVTSTAKPTSPQPNRQQQLQQQQQQQLQQQSQQLRSTATVSLQPQHNQPQQNNQQQQHRQVTQQTQQIQGGQRVITTTTTSTTSSRQQQQPQYYEDDEEEESEEEEEDDE